MLNTIAAKIFGTKNEREVKRLMPSVERINALEPQMQALTDAQLRAKTEEFRQRLAPRNVDPVGAVRCEPSTGFTSGRHTRSPAKTPSASTSVTPQIVMAFGPLMAAE